MFEDELDAINKQINKWEDKIAEGIEDIAEGFMDSLYAMKEGVERKIQKHNLEKELESKFEQHIDTNSQRLRNDGDTFWHLFSKESNVLKEKIEEEYEAASSKKVEANFEDTNNKMQMIEQDFSRVVLTCSKRSFF